MFVKKGDVTKRREGEYPQSCAKRMTAPSAEGAFGEGSVCGRGISCLRARPKDGARLAALRSPFGNLRPITLQTVW